VSTALTGAHTRTAPLERREAGDLGFPGPHLSWPMRQKVVPSTKPKNAVKLNRTALYVGYRQ
jgi:hypothetical protein